MHKTVHIYNGVLLWIVMAAVMLVSCESRNMSNNVIVENKDYTVTSDSVVMGDFIAYSPDGLSIITNYKCKAQDSISNILKARIIIGERDIELLPAHYHYIDLNDTSECITFKAFQADSVKPSKSPTGVAMPLDVQLSIDMSDMLKTLKEDGIYVTPTRDTIYNQDFENQKLELAINTSLAPEPMRIRFDDSQSVDGLYKVTVPLNPKTPIQYTNWTSSLDPTTSTLPSYESKQKIMNALYNMSLESINAESDKRTLVASECYDIALALAYLEPKKSMETLESMVVDSVIHIDSDKRSYASFSNELIWAEAAWSVYCATGDKNWLKRAYHIIRKSLKHVEDMAPVNGSGLYHALCPYDSRYASQYYPSWASVTDAYQTTPLVANAIIEHSYIVLGQIADEFELNEPYDTHASRIKDAINHRLWNEARGSYCQYLYGGVSSFMSPCVDNLGQALAILWDIADDNRTETLISETPISNFGVPTLYPNRENVGVGINNAVMPMVQALWNLAAAKASNMNVLRRGMGALIFQQALAASCSTSCNATTGELIPSTNPRGNASGNIAMVLRVLAGMNFLPDGIEFNPRVPECFFGTKTIKGLRYRNAVLNITINGTGDECSEITLDGKAIPDNFINGNLEGEHVIVIKMNNKGANSGSMTAAAKTLKLPETPQWLWDGFYGTNYNYNKALGYKIFINGEPTYAMRDSVLGTRDTVTYRSYTIVAINKYGHSFIAKPHPITTTARYYPAAKSNHDMLSSRAFPANYSYHPVELSGDSTTITIPVNTNEAGSYIIDVLYSNGNGPLAWNSPLELINISCNSHNQGVVTLPPVGEGQWLTMSYSSQLIVRLLKGKNTITLTRVGQLGNQSGDAPLLIEHIRLIKLPSKS